MRRRATLFGWAGMLFLAQACAAPATFGANTYFGFSIGVSNAPPPPRVVYVEEPDVVVVPGTSVYVIEDTDYDVFRYRSRYYMYNDGYWYRARSPRGSFVVIDARSVPRAVLRLPARHWKHHPHGGPPGQMKKRWKHY